MKNLEDYVQAAFSVPLTNETMPFMSWVHESADVKEVKFMSDSVQVSLEANPLFVEKVRKRVEEFNGKFGAKTKTK